MFAPAAAVRANLGGGLRHQIPERGLVRRCPQAAGVGRKKRIA